MGKAEETLGEHVARACDEIFGAVRAAREEGNDIMPVIEVKFIAGPDVSFTVKLHVPEA